MGGSDTKARKLEIRPTWICAGVLLLVAGFGVYLYSVHHLRAWMPNVVVGAITVALTITIVDLVVKAEGEARLKPLRAGVLEDIGATFESLLFGLAVDYADRPVPNPLPMPEEPLAVIDLWLSPRATPTPDNWVPQVLAEVDQFARGLEHFRQRDRDVIPVDLRVGIDAYQKKTKGSARFGEQFLANPTDDKLRAVVIYTTRRAVQHTREWFVLYSRFAPTPVVLSKPFREICDQIMGLGDEVTEDTIESPPG